MNKFKKLVLENKYLSWLQFFSNWLMQGITHADKSERFYKILFTLLFGIIFSMVVNFLKPNDMMNSIIIGFLMSHTLNWLINNNFYVLLIHRIKWLKTSKGDLFNHLDSMQERLRKINGDDWLLYSVSLGGICNGTLNNHSDIDVSLIRKPGLLNMCKAVVFYVKEKKIADLNGVPLDIFICDSPQNCILRSKFQKNPIVLSDQNTSIDSFYPEGLSITIKEAELLNNYEPRD